MNDTTTNGGTKKAAAAVQSSIEKGYTGIMGNVYIVFAGESCGPRALISAHHSEAAARVGAESHIRKVEIATGAAHYPDVGGRAWTSASGRYCVVIETHPVV